MSNLNVEKEYYSINEMLDFVLDEYKKTFYVSLPAIIKSYDQSTKRAMVLPAVKITYEDGSSNEMPILNDVPVLFPSGGGYTITMPIQNGDAILLCFSHRSIEEFKESFSLSTPHPQIMQLNDCVAIAGFGSLNITPAGNGASIQNDNGTNAVIVESDKINIKKGSNTLQLSDSEMTANISGATLTLTSGSLVSSVPIDAPSFASGGSAASMPSGLSTTTINGINFSSHVHSDPQGGITGAPQ